MPNPPSVERITELQQMIADFAKIARAVNLADNKQRENDVEHSFGLALTSWFLHDKLAPQLDLGKVLKYALSHDIVEIHAGDTYVFDEVAVATKQARESEALERLTAEWTDFPELTSSARAYADKLDEEARFVYAIDKLLPVIMIELDDAAAVWRRMGITLEMERRSKVSILQSDIVAPYYEKLLTWLEERDNIPRN